MTAVALGTAMLLGAGPRAHAEDREVHGAPLGAVVISADSIDADAVVSSSIAAGIAEARSPGANGAEGVLGRHQAAIAERTWRALSPPIRRELGSLLARAQSQAERSLIVKAMAARSAELTGADPTARMEALRELCGFAEEIRGLERGQLLRETSLLDIDETFDSSSFDPLALDRPPEYPRGYSQAENDGLFQRYENSCGPTSIEVMRGELDPIYAWRVRRGDITANPPAADDFQRSVLVTYGEDPSSRIVPHHQARVRGMIDRALAAGTITRATGDVLAQYLLERGPETAEAKAAVARLQQLGNGYPGASVVRTLRDYPAVDANHRYNRIGLKNMLRLLNAQVGQRIGVEYELVTLYAEAKTKLRDDDITREAPGFARGHLDAVVKHLESGVDVLFGTTWPDHFWSMSNVRTVAGGRELLVHDPWSGKTAWVPESELVSGAFAKRFLGEGKTETKVDLFFVPR